MLAAETEERSQRPVSEGMLMTLANMLFTIAGYNNLKAAKCALPACPTDRTAEKLIQTQVFWSSHTPASSSKGPNILGKPEARDGYVLSSSLVEGAVPAGTVTKKVSSITRV